MQSSCKSCKRIYMRKYRKEHNQVLRQKKLEYYYNNHEQMKQRHRDWCRDNPDTVRAYSQKWYVENKPEDIKRNLAYINKRLKEDINFKLRFVLRGRVRSAVMGRKKVGSAIRDLGCSIQELKLYLEAQFKPGMSWDNWGKRPGCWQIDHIMPLSAFDLTNRQHFILASHYCNLQPLWLEENMRKRASTHHV